MKNQKRIAIVMAVAFIFSSLAGCSKVSSKEELPETTMLSEESVVYNLDTTELDESETTTETTEETTTEESTTETTVEETTENTVTPTETTAGPTAIPTAIPTTSPGGETSYVCPICGDSFGELSLYNSHINSAHVTPTPVPTSTPRPTTAPTATPTPTYTQTRVRTERTEINRWSNSEIALANEYGVTLPYITITYVITTSQVPEQVEVIMLDSDGNPVLDANGAPVYTTETVMKTVLYVEMHSRSATDEATELGFNDDQMSQLEQLLSTSNIPYWQSLLGGVIGITDTYVMPDDENCIYIYNFLRNTMGLSRAQACAIIANIQYESSFNPHALGDNGTSYGLCQWHNERWTNMQTWCANHGYDYTTVEGQCAYLQHDLVDLHSSIYNYIANVPDTPEGAYDAAAYWCIHYEVPEDAQAKSVQRGNTAIMYYWSMN